MTIKKVPKTELDNRMARFVRAMDNTYENWEVCIITGGMSLYYLTGTICDGLLFIRRGEKPSLWVRKSFERASMESEFENIRQMGSFRELANFAGTLPDPRRSRRIDTLYLDMAQTSLEWHRLFSKYIRFGNLLPVDAVMLKVRAVKSRYELELMENAGSTVDRLLREELPSFLHEGISEAELGADMFSVFIKNGYHGVSRFSMKNADVVLGHIGFGANALYPSLFNGASGLAGLCPASPVLGSRETELCKGDLIYIDIGFGLEGYNVDKTLIYTFGKPQSNEVNAAHRHCLELEDMAVSMMKPGAKPSDIYNAVCESVKPEFRNCFMGAPGRAVRFLGHGVGLYIDEFPVIAKRFDEPLECGMTIAIEPKIGLEGFGMVGSENTYLITETGAKSLTGERREIIEVC